MSQIIMRLSCDTLSKVALTPFFDKMCSQLLWQGFLDDNRIEMVSQVNCLDFPCGIMLLKVLIWSCATQKFSNQQVVAGLLL